MRFFLFFFVFLCSFSIVIAFANLPSIPESPGEPVFPPPVIPPPSEDSESAAAGMGGGAFPSSNSTNVSVDTSVDNSVSTSSPVVSNNPDVVDEGVSTPEVISSDDLLSVEDVGEQAYSWLFPLIGLVLIVATIVIVFVIRKKRNDNLPSSLKKF